MVRCREEKFKKLVLIMLDDQPTSQKVPVKLSNGAIVNIEVNQKVGGRNNVSSNVFDFDDISDVVEGLTVSIKKTLEKAKPQKATVKFGLEVSTESGKLVSSLVKGSGKATLEVTLEWNSQE